VRSSRRATRFPRPFFIRWRYIAATMPCAAVISISIDMLPRVLRPSRRQRRTQPTPVTFTIVCPRQEAALIRPRFQVQPALARLTQYGSRRCRRAPASSVARQQRRCEVLPCTRRCGLSRCAVVVHADSAPLRQIRIYACRCAAQRTAARERTGRCAVRRLNDAVILDTPEYWSLTIVTFTAVHTTAQRRHRAHRMRRAVANHTATH